MLFCPRTTPRSSSLRIQANLSKLPRLRTMSSTHKPVVSTEVSKPGEAFEVRQTTEMNDFKPDPSKSLPLSPVRQRLIDDLIDLYSCKPTVEKVKRYAPDCVYDDQFVYADNVSIH